MVNFDEHKTSAVPVNVFGLGGRIPRPFILNGGGALESVGAPDVGGNFCLHFVKGMARTCSLLCLLDLVSRMETSQHDYFANLLASACIVFATVETHFDWVSVAIANANISARGAIRQAHDVITWAGKLQKLAAKRRERGKCHLTI